MKDEGKILLLCLPFAAGTALFPALSERLQLPPEAVGTAALAACAILAFICSSNKSGRFPFAALFFFCGIFCSATHAACPVPLPHGPFFRAAEKTAGAFLSLIGSVPFNSPVTAPLLKALLCADRSGLSLSVKTTFRSSGASHLLALSGLHLGVIYSIVSRAASILGNTPAARTCRALLIIICACFYTLMTGASPSIVRALIFISISELRSLNAGRGRKPLRVLAAALTIQLALNPGVISSLGFQLSYLAMCGICILMPWINGLWPQEENPERTKYDIMRKIWNNVAMSLSCQVFTAPLVWLKFHTFPHYFLLTNLLAMPLTTALIALAVLTLALSALGICPEIAVRLTDRTAGLLLRTLEIIASM